MSRQFLHIFARLQRNCVTRPAALSIPFHYANSECCTRNLSTTNFQQKVHQQKKTQPLGISDDELLRKANIEFTGLKERLIEEFNRHFSMKTDLRIYEDCNVTMPDGQILKMNNLGRILMKNPKMVMINFNDNPSAIKAAMLALQNSAICSNPQQEGTIIYVPVPEVSRAFREKTAENARFIFNDYKKALNEIFSKFSDKNDVVEKSKDQQMRRRNALLALKREFESYGEKLMKEKRAALMKEIL